MKMKEKSVEELVADSYYFGKKTILKGLNELNDLGFDDRTICKILIIDYRTIKGFRNGKHLYKPLFIKLLAGIDEIKKQHEYWEKIKRKGP